LTTDDQRKERAWIPPSVIHYYRHPNASGLRCSGENSEWKSGRNAAEGDAFRRYKFMLDRSIVQELNLALVIESRGKEKLSASVNAHARIMALAEHNLKNC